MRNLLILFICITPFIGHAQDSLFFKNGSVKAVQIIEMDTLANLVGYVFEGDTIYASTRSFARVLYKDKSSSISDLVHKAVINDTEKIEAARDDLIRPNPKYNYDKWAISTNLTSIFRSHEMYVYSSNPSFSIEPEYFINNHFSIKAPLYFGLPLTKKLGSFYSRPHEMLPGSEIGDLPTVRYVRNYNHQLGHVRDLLFQIGINPKYYFKGQRTFAWYLSQGFYLSQINLNQVNYYYTFEKDANGYYPAWAGNLTYESIKEKNWIFRYEGAIGLSVNLLKDIGLSAEFGYTTFIKRQNDNFDQVFIRADGGDFELDPYLQKYEPNYSSKEFVTAYCRAHLVYRFGGEKNEVK